MSPNTVLYAGPDLENAFERSSPPPVKQSRGPAGQNLLAAARHAAETTQRAALTQVREVICRGSGPGAGEGLKLRYVGTGRNLPFLVGACLDVHRVESDRKLGPLEVRGAALRTDRGEDLLLLDTDSAIATLGDRRPALRMAPWLKQRVTVPPSWPEFLGSLPSKARRNVARCLRKYGYTARIDDSDDAFRRFYHRMYRPHVSDRFGGEAVVLDEASFLRALRGAHLVELLHEGDVVAANSVRLAGHWMWILWCGVSDEVASRELKGTTDVLDYFSILYGVRSGCSRIDLGRARPRLNDGPLVYKAKWRAELQLSRLQRPALCLLPRNLRPATAASLARGCWISRIGRRLHGVVLLDSGPASTDDLERVAKQYRYRGLEGIRVCALHGIEPGVAREHWRAQGIDPVDLRAARDPLAAYTGT